MIERIEYAPLALKDLKSIHQDVLFVSKSISIADRYINDLMDHVESYASSPRAATPLYFEEAFSGYYFVVFKAYIAFYRIQENVMKIDRVLPGKSDYLRHLMLQTSPRMHESSASYTERNTPETP